MSPPLPRDLDLVHLRQTLARLTEAGLGDLTLAETHRIVQAESAASPAISWW